MDQLHSVPPDAVRFWRGFKLSHTSYSKFCKLLGSMFIPLTAQIQSPLGLTAYLPAILPEDKPESLPDEIALVFYTSQEAYKQTYKSVGGRTYGKLHSLLFDFITRRSRSGFPEYLKNTLKPDTPYFLFSNETDWFHGTSQVFIGSRKIEQPPELFINPILKIVKKIQQNPARELDGAYILVSNEYVIYWEHHRNSTDLPRSKTMNALSEISQQILQKEAVKTVVPVDPAATYEGVEAKEGECYCIQFKRNNSSETYFGGNTMAPPVFGLYGESHTAPPDTLVSYWAALGAGASGIVASVHLQKDGSLLCGSPNSKDGKNFQSVELDNENHPTGVTGSDTPWKKSWRRPPELATLLHTFGRRSSIMLLLDNTLEGQKSLAGTEKLISELNSFGLAQRITIIGNSTVCQHISEQSKLITTAFIWEKERSAQENIDTATTNGAKALFLVWENIADNDTELINSAGFDLLISSSFPAPSQDFLEKIKPMKRVRALVMRGVDKTMQLIRPPSVVLADDFSGTKINRRIWSCGYSHINSDTTLAQDDGFIISIKAGGDYSGGAAVTTIPIHGDFDVQVDFRVESPQQATTFELAAIGVDPGYFNIDTSKLTSKKVNLTFDVHGAPPYASSERDEADGFRIGWNNSHNFVKIDSDWKASSANMFNKYGGDVGNGDADSPSGTLRLTRNGSVFNSYYKDKYNPSWVCSGSTLVHNLSDEVFIRLAAKHWKKGGIPPENKIIFSNFVLSQF